MNIQRQQEHPISNNSKETQLSANIETISTILSFLCGIAIAGFGIHWAIILIIIPMIFIVTKYTHLSLMQQSKIQVTMVVFGLLDGYFMQLKPIDTLIWLNTIRFYGQFQLINNYHHSTLSWESFLIYHSRQYFCANSFAILQHVLTSYFLQCSYKQKPVFFLPAFVIASISMILRLLAFFTAKSNFTHKVAYRKRQKHQLVTNGVYAIFRHPSYTGFFYFSVSTMLMIGNYVSAFIYCAALMFFFQDRIEFEQYYLHTFFGRKYEEYSNNTYILIPRFPQKIMRLLKKQQKQQ